MPLIIGAVKADDCQSWWFCSVTVVLNVRRPKLASLVTVIKNSTFKNLSNGLDYARLCSSVSVMMEYVVTYSRYYDTYINSCVDTSLLSYSLLHT